MAYQQQYKQAFSLIDLLVVIVLIALLISIVVPGLANSKEHARRAVCKSNLHGIDQISRTREDYDEQKNWRLDSASFFEYIAEHEFNGDVFDCPSSSLDSTGVFVGDYQPWGPYLGGFGHSDPPRSPQAEMICTDRIYDVLVTPVPSPGLRELSPSRNHDEKYCNGLFADGHTEGRSF